MMTTGNWQHFHYLWAAQEALFLLAVVFVIAIVKESLVGMVISVLALIGLLWLFRSGDSRKSVSPEDAVLVPCSGQVKDAVCDRAGGFSRIVIESRWLDGYALIAPVDGRVRTSALNAEGGDGGNWTVEIESVIGVVTLRVGGDIRNLMPFVEAGDTVSKGKPIGLAKWGCLCDLTYPLYNMEVVAGGDTAGIKGSRIAAGDVLGRVQMIWK